MKLTKINAETAKLYQLAGLGMIANELPFQARVQQELRVKYNMLALAAPMDVEHEEDIVWGGVCGTIGKEEKHYVEIDFQYLTHDDALEAVLQEALNLLIKQ